MYSRISQILLVFLLFVLSNLQGQTKRLFDFNEGLSNSLINEVYQDHLGFIWLATEDGLNRFDGIKFNAFSKNPENTSSLKANFVTALTEDRNDNLWVGQINGLQIYSPEKESFEEFEIFIDNKKIHPYVSSIIQSSSGDIWITTSGFGLIQIKGEIGRSRYSTQLNKRLCSLYLQTIYEDKSGLLWIGSDNEGLNTFNPFTQEIETYSNQAKGNHKIPSNDISAICEDQKGNIYIGSIKGGLARINKNSGTIDVITSANVYERNMPVKSLFFDSKNRLWVGTDGLGIKQLNPKTDQLESFTPNTTSFDFSKSKIHSIIEDNAGNIWLGIFQKGLYLIPEIPEIFNHFGYSAFDKNSIGSSSITAIDGLDNQLWIGTDGDGIYHLNRITKTVEHVVVKNKTGEIVGNNVISMHNSSSEYLWIGTFFNGLIRYNKQTGEVKTYTNDPENDHSIVNDKITVIKKDNKHQLWLGTLGGGICRFNLDDELFYPGLDLPDSINNMIPKWVNDIFIDRNENFWIGTYDGLIYINTKTQALKIFCEANVHLDNNLVYCIQSDALGNIWVGTYGGLMKFDPESFESKLYNTKNGLGSNVICAINEDEYQQLWISTHKGLSRFNPQDESFTNYYASDGLQSNEFSRNTTYKSQNQELFFGGINGITEIKRDYQNYSRRIRDVMLTDFLLFDKKVKIGQQSGKQFVLNKSIVLADTVNLSEHDNAFSIGFTSVELANQSRITYEYKMEGFDTNWIASNALGRAATYTNLKHGTYTFYVRGVDKEQYSNPRKLTIIIHPPWYRTVWAKILWILLTSIFFYSIILFNKEKVMRIEAEKMNEMKMQFFINISHEIKTPLTLIIDPLEKLLSQKTNDETGRLYQIMHQNASRIFRLINQLLDVRKIDKGRILVKFQNTNLLQFIREIEQSYELLAANKKISFRIETSDPDIQVWIDPLNFEKVILNLLSNAFKFTPTEGEVRVFISKETNKKGVPNRVKIVVSDNGIGLKKTEIERIFNRFYQVYSEETRTNNTGTGIGLHLSRSLVKLHKGELYAESRTDGPGSNFIILLPLGNEHLPKSDLIIEENLLPAPSHKIHVDAMPDIHKPTAGETKPKTGFKIFIVEDEEEIRNYLIYDLAPFYKIVACENGKQAHEKLLEEKPDLIISDIMMPEMDGITLCKKIKGNILTSHIPVVLLTAMSKEEDKAEGIETGADMYLVKPFNSDFLKKTIANILENRRKIYEQLQNKNEHYQIANIEIKSHDEILMQKVMTIVKENISDGNLNVEMLADGVGISRVHMHRKLKELTNQSARDFIKNIRMKQASYLLTNKKLNISEVAYSVGYSNLSHFSNSFKAYYGVSPKEYIQKQHHKINVNDLME